MPSSPVLLWRFVSLFLFLNVQFTMNKNSWVKNPQFVLWNTSQSFHVETFSAAAAHWCNRYTQAHKASAYFVEMHLNDKLQPNRTEPILFEMGPRNWRKRRKNKSNAQHLINEKMERWRNCSENTEMIAWFE